MDEAVLAQLQDAQRPSEAQGGLGESWIINMVNPLINSGFILFIPISCDIGNGVTVSYITMDDEHLLREARSIIEKGRAAWGAPVRN